MSKLTIKSGCVEAAFKRGRLRTKSTERAQPLDTEQPTPTSEIPLRDAGFDTPQQMTQSQDDGKSSGRRPNGGKR